MDIKAEHYERAVQRAEQERDAMEKKLDVRIKSDAVVFALTIRWINRKPMTSSRPARRSSKSWSRRWTLW